MYENSTLLVDRKLLIEVTEYEHDPDLLKVHMTYETEDWFEPTIGKTGGITCFPVEPPAPSFSCDQCTIGITGDLLDFCENGCRRRELGPSCELNCQAPIEPSFEAFCDEFCLIEEPEPEPIFGFQSLFNWPNHEEWSDQYEYNDFFVNVTDDGEFEWSTFSGRKTGYRRYRTYWAEPEDLPRYALNQAPREKG